MRNYEDVLAQLHAAGLTGRGVDDGLQIGRVVRCRVEGDRERRGWYLLHEFKTDTDVLLVGSFGIWHGNDNGAQKIQLKKSEVSPEQLQAMKARWAEDKKKAEAARKTENERAAEKARVSWSQGAEVDENQYLARKGVNSYGLKQTPGGVLMIPMLDTAGKIHGLQLIRSAAEAKASQRPEKEFWPVGLAKKGHFFQIGTPQHVVLVAEGYATGASLHAATGLPVAIAFDANNLAPVAAALRKRYRGVKVLLCADDDAFATCPILIDGAKCATRLVLAAHPTHCPDCGGEHKRQNTGVGAASAAALEVDGAWIKPQWSDDTARTERFLKQGHKHSDFNDLHLDDGLQAVRAQVEALLTERGWLSAGAPAGRKATTGGGVNDGLTPIETLDELLSRYSLVYGQGGTVFDHAEHCLLSVSDMRDACMNRYIHRNWSEHPNRQIVRVQQVGFDPGMQDKNITCNLWGGWPTKPKPGNCEKLLEMLRYMCSTEVHGESLYRWVLRWLAYPLQHPGAKMKTTLVLHGPQGAGKNMFFEAYMDIFGQYGRVIDQGAVEDKFNDWCSRKLFLIADEVLARSDIYHIKNKLKSLITGEWVRINPKQMKAYDERNHMNMVFLSNETMPVLLEEDDRRHVVIWTPDKLRPEFYTAVAAEIAGGGSAALFDYLLNLDLGDFSPSTAPHVTAAKMELINLSLDATSRFYYALEMGEVGAVKLAPGLSEDYYDLYRVWSLRTGHSGKKGAPLSKLINAFVRKHGAVTVRKRYSTGWNEYGPHTVLMPVGSPAPDPERPEKVWLGEQIDAFKTAVAAYKAEKWTA